MTWIALARKDLRLLRPIWLAAVVLAVCFYGILPALMRQLMQVDRATIAEVDVREQSVALMLLASLALFAGTGGMAFALERRERWGEFAAFLPVARWRLVTTKLFIATAVCFALILLNVLTAWAVMTIRVEAEFPIQPVMANLYLQAGPFGVWWVIAILTLGVVIETLLRGRSPILRFKVGAGVLLILLALEVLLTVVMLGQPIECRVVHVPLDLRVTRLDMVQDCVMVYLCAAVFLFGLAWVLSSMLRSPVLATTISISAVGGTFIGALNMLAAFERGRIERGQVSWHGPIWLAGLGLLAVVVGSVVQTFRRSP